MFTYLDCESLLGEFSNDKNKYNYVFIMTLKWIVFQTTCDQ